VKAKLKSTNSLAVSFPSRGILCSRALNYCTRALNICPKALNISSRALNIKYLERKKIFLREKKDFCQGQNKTFTNKRLYLKPKPRKPFQRLEALSEPYVLSVMSLSLRACSSANAISLITSTIVVTSPRKKNPALGGKTVKAECRVKIAFELC